MSDICTFDRRRLDGTAPQSWQLAALLSMLEKRSTEIWHIRPRFSIIGRWHISCCSSHNFGRGQSSLGKQLALDLRYAPAQEQWSLLLSLLRCGRPNICCDRYLIAYSTSYFVHHITYCCLLLLTDTCHCSMFAAWSCSLLFSVVQLLLTVACCCSCTVAYCCLLLMPVVVVYCSLTVGQLLLLSVARWHS